MSIGHKLIICFSSIFRHVRYMRKATISFVVSYSLSVRMEQLGSN
jgi:hypothetical protein